jgi:hypothetical protein
MHIIKQTNKHNNSLKFNWCYNSVLYYLLFMLSQQPEDQLQTQHSVKKWLHKGETQHKVKE